MLSNKVFDALKWLVLVAIPAFTTAFVGLDAIFGWGYGDIVSKCSVILCTLIGSLLGISTIQYQKQNGVLEPPDFDDEE